MKRPSFDLPNTGIESPSDNTRTVENAVRERNQLQFRQLFGTTEPSTITAENALAESTTPWIRNLIQKGPPKGFKQSGWESWSAQQTAQNFALLQIALGELPFNPAQKAAITGYILDLENNRESYDVRTGHADVQEIHIIPDPDNAQCVLEFNYIRSEDVRNPKKEQSGRKVYRIALNAEAFSAAKRTGFALEGITEDGIDAQKLATMLLSKQRGMSNTPAAQISRADLIYDVERGVASIHATIVRRDADDRARSLGSVAVAVIDEKDFFTSTEVALIKNTPSNSRMQQKLLDTIIHRKSQGFSISKHASLSTIPEKDRSVKLLEENAKHIVGDSLAQELQEQTNRQIIAFRKESALKWRTDLYHKAMRDIDEQRKTNPPGILNETVRSVSRFFSLKKDDPAADQKAEKERRGAVERKVWEQILLAQITSKISRNTVDEITEFTSIPNTRQLPSRAEARISLTVSVSGPEAITINNPETNKPFLLSCQKYSAEKSFIINTEKQKE